MKDTKVAEELEIKERLNKIESLLVKFCINPKSFLSFKEAQNYLDISSSHLYKLTSTKQIPYYCPSGKKIYFKQCELDEWIEFKRLPSKLELKKRVNSYD